MSFWEGPGKNPDSSNEDETSSLVASSEESSCSQSITPPSRPDLEFIQFKEGPKPPSKTAELEPGSGEKYPKNHDEDDDGEEEEKEKDEDGGDDDHWQASSPRRSRRGIQE